MECIELIRRPSYMTDKDKLVAHKYIAHVQTNDHVKHVEELKEICITTEPVEPEPSKEPKMDEVELFEEPRSTSITTETAFPELLEEIEPIQDPISISIKKETVKSCVKKAVASKRKKEEWNQRPSTAKTIADRVKEARIKEFFASMPGPSGMTDEEKIAAYERMLEEQRKEKKRKQEAERAKRLQNINKPKTEKPKRIRSEMKRKKADAERSRQYRLRKKLEREQERARLAELAQNVAEATGEKLKSEPMDELARAEQKKKAEAERAKRYRIRKKLERELKSDCAALGIELIEKPLKEPKRELTKEEQKRKSEAERLRRYRIRKKLEIERKARAAEMAEALEKQRQRSERLRIAAAKARLVKAQKKMAAAEHAKNVRLLRQQKKKEAAKNKEYRPRTNTVKKKPKRETYAQRKMELERSARETTKHFLDYLENSCALASSVCNRLCFPEIKMEPRFETFELRMEPKTFEVAEPYQEIIEIDREIKQEYDYDSLMVTSNPSIKQEIIH